MVYACGPLRCFCGEDTLDKNLLRSLQGEDERTESSNCMYVEVRNESSEDPRQLSPGSAGMLQCLGFRVQGAFMSCGSAHFCIAG